jgi:hypothetical protein
MKRFFADGTINSKANGTQSYIAINQEKQKIQNAIAFRIRCQGASEVLRSSKWLFFLLLMLSFKAIGG